MAACRRGVRREGKRPPAEAVPGRPRAGGRRRPGGQDTHGLSRGEEHAQLGRGLARDGAVGQARAGRFLDSSPSAEPQGHRLARDHEGHRDVPPHRSRQRTCDACELACEHRSRGAGWRRSPNGPVDALQLPRPRDVADRGVEEAARREGSRAVVQGRPLLLPARPLGGALRLDVRRRPVRPDEHLLRGRRDEGARQATAATSAATACR